MIFNFGQISILGVQKDIFIRDVYWMFVPRESDKRGKLVEVA